MHFLRVISVSINIMLLEKNAAFFLYSSKTRCLNVVHLFRADPHSSFGSVQDLRTRDRWFDPRLGQYSFRELTIFITTGFIPLQRCPLFRQVGKQPVVWEEYYAEYWLKELKKMFHKCTCKYGSRASRINTCTYLTNHKLSSIHSLSLPRNGSNSNSFSHVGKK